MFRCVAPARTTDGFLKPLGPTTRPGHCSYRINVVAHIFRFKNPLRRLPIGVRSCRDGWRLDQFAAIPVLDELIRSAVAATHPVCFIEANAANAYPANLSCRNAHHERV